MSTAIQMRQQDAEADAAAREEFAREQAEQKQTTALIAPVVVEQKAVLQNADGTPTSAGWRKIGEAFRREIPSKQFTAGKRGTFSYITARQVAKRLDDVVGPGNWSTDWQCIRAEHPVAVRVGLCVFGVWRWDAGYSNNPAADEETDKAYEDEPLKAAVSDGFKRAAVQWGIGRFLYGDT